MQTMRYINLLDKVSRVKTSKCFVHNNTIFFAVSQRDISKAIGPNAENIKKIQNSLGKKVKIITEAKGVENARKFIENVVAPIKFKSLEIRDEEMLITAGNNQNKASLIGRDKRRYEELNKIVKNFFGMDLRII